MRWRNGVSWVAFSVFGRDVGIAILLVGILVSGTFVAIFLRDILYLITAVEVALVHSTILIKTAWQLLLLLLLLLSRIIRVAAKISLLFYIWVVRVILAGSQIIALSTRIALSASLFCLIATVRWFSCHICTSWLLDGILNDVFKARLRVRFLLLTAWALLDVSMVALDVQAFRVRGI